MTLTAKSDARQALEGVLDDLATAFKTRDRELATRFYVRDDRYVMYDVEPPLMDVGFDLVREKVDRFFSLVEGPIELEFSDTHIGAADTLGYVRSIMHVRAGYSDGRPALEQRIRYTAIAELIDGEWRVTHEHLSVPGAEVST